MNAYNARLALTAILGMLLPAPARAEYIVQRGDVLDINVLAAPGLHRRAPIDASGQMSMPVIGEVDAAGLSLGQLREKLREMLTRQNIIHNASVTIDIAEYRPVYVTGDVVKPGAYPYRPGMTVRDVVALAEGFDLLHMRGRDPAIEAADAKGDYQSAAIELAKQTVRAARVRAELAGPGQIDLKDPGALPVQPKMLSDIIQIEKQQLISDQEDSERERSYLLRTIKATQEQLNSLQQQENHAAIALEQQTKMFARARELLQQGLLQLVRMEDSQKAVAAAQNIFYDAQAHAAQVNRDLEDAKRKLESADDQRRIRLLQELREGVALIATARSRLEAGAEKMRYTAAAQSRRASGDPMEPPEVTIYRLRNGERQQTGGDEATPLLPGDNLQITTKSEMFKLLGLASPARDTITSK